MLIIKFAVKKLFLNSRKYFVASTAAALLAVAPATYADVDGPLLGDPTLLGTTSFKLSDVGYEQSEYFISGTAKSYKSAVPLATNGKWSVSVADTAYYKTRFVVYRPSDPAKFNGTVIVEWFNVSGGTEASSQWIMTHAELIRKGYAWVGVSAQKAGIDGGGVSLSGLSLPLKLLNLVRYLTLVHPGDKYSFDMFSQVARAVVRPNWWEPNPLKGLTVKRAIAAGESQSADFMLTYANAVAPIDKLFNGYFIHSRVHGTVGLTPDSNPIMNFSSRATMKLRDDLGVPSMMLMTETDLTFLGALPDRQDDSKNIRTWEIAGAAHADDYVSTSGLADKGTDPAIAKVVENKNAVPVLVTCDRNINSGPQHFVANAAIAALDNWIRTGYAPTNAPRLQLTGSPAAFVRDSVGNALGGIRTPYVDAPMATLSGEGNSFSALIPDDNKNTLCKLFGTTQLLSSTQLMSLYPNHATYVAAVNNSVDGAVLKGFLLKPDGDLIKSWANSSSIGNY
ncbi:MAG: alpha/beta hydrolase domain-containing protein [Spongiibacteraceae bacterium]